MFLKSMIFFGCLFISCYLFGEIEQVELQFRPGACVDHCPDNLQKQLTKIKGAHDFSVNGPGGSASFKWTPGQKFNWPAILTAVRLAGMSLHDTIVTVSGEIRVAGKTLEIISSGDGSIFRLLGTPSQIQSGFVTTWNIENRKLSPEMEQKLLQGGKDNQEAVIKGPLFMPWRGYNPPFLVATDVSWRDRKQATTTAPTKDTQSIRFK